MALCKWGCGKPAGIGFHFESECAPGGDIDGLLAEADAWLENFPHDIPRRLAAALRATRADLAAANELATDAIRGVDQQTARAEPAERERDEWRQACFNAQKDSESQANRAERAERERDALRAERLAEGAFHASAETRCLLSGKEPKSVAEVLSERLVAVERERDGAYVSRDQACEMLEGEVDARQRAERERDEARYHYELAASQRDAARAALRDVMAELAGWVNDGSVICGCRQSEAHGQNDYIKLDECESHGAINRARRALGEEP